MATLFIKHLVNPRPKGREFACDALIVNGLLLVKDLCDQRDAPNSTCCRLRAMPVSLRIQAAGAGAVCLRISVYAGLFRKMPYTGIFEQ